MVAVALLTLQAVFAIMVAAGSSRVPNDGVVRLLVFLPLLLGTGVSALNAIRSTQSIRLFWSFFSLSCALWAVNSSSWIYYVAFLRKDHPVYLFASVPLFLQPIFLIAAVASRPHVKLPSDKPHRTTSNVLQLLFVWVFAYAFVLSPVDYTQWDAALIQRGGVLYAAENLLLIAVLAVAPIAVRPPWKGIYGQLLGASVLYALGSLAEHVVLVSGTRSAGLDNLLHTAAACWFVWAALQGRKLAPQLAESVQIDSINPKYASTLAMGAVMAIPIVGVWELFRVDELSSTRAIRLCIVLLAILFLAATAFITEHFTRRELSSDVEITHDRLRMAMASGKSVGWEWDVASGRDSWFGDLQTMFGIQADNFSGTAEDFYRCLHPDDRQRVSQEVSDARENHRPYDAEFRVVRQDGVLRWVAARGAFHYAKDGHPERMLGMAVDITERKHGEEALKSSEEKFSKAFRESPMALTLTSANDHRYLEVNDTFQQITGWKRDEVIGRTPIDIRLWQNSSEGLDFVKRLQTEGSIRNAEVRFRCKDGTLRTGLGSAELIDIANEPCVLSVIADITERKQIGEKLHESEQRLHGVVDSAMDAIIAVDEEQRIVLFNAAAEKMFGCSANDASGTAIERFIPERFQKEHAKHLRRFGESGVTNRTMGALKTLWGVRSNGEEFPIEASISCADTEGKKLFTVIIRDMTERRQIEIAQKQSEERLHLAVQAGRMYVYEWDASSDIILRSPECVNILGSRQLLKTSRREMLARVHPDDRGLVESFFNGIAPGNPTSHLSYRFLRSDGSVIWLETRARAIFDEKGTLQRTVGVVVDVTDRKQAELAIRESEERFRSVANTAPVMIWMSGRDRLFTYFNQPWLKFTGRPIEAELGNGWAESVHPEDRNGCLDTYTRAFDQQQPFNMQYRLRRHDGEYRWLLDTAVPRFEPDGSFAGYIGSCIDVTDRERAEEALATMGRRLIEAHEEERTRIARELHDDINQRLALLAVELEQWNQGIPETASNLHNLAQQARQRLFDITRDVQSLSHGLHSSKLEYLGITVAANSYCKEFAEQHKVHVEFNHSEIPRSLRAEASLTLFRVLQEALQNAVKHSRAREFRVELGGTSNEVHVSVSDPGVGFDQTAAMGGRGLGLISMRERLQLVRGSLAIESKVGRGTTIRATVPVEADRDEMSLAG